MLRIVVTALITAIVVIAWMVINPSNSSRQFLDTLGLLDVLQENYAASPEDTSSPVPSTAPSSPGTPLPQESNLAVRPGQATPTPPSSGTPPPQARPLPPKTAPATSRGPDYDQMIANLEKENQDLKTKIALYESRRGNSSIPSADRKAIQRQIDDNKARIAELKAWKAKAN
jgi:hypothetical protein